MLKAVFTGNVFSDTAYFSYYVPLPINATSTAR